MTSTETPRTRGRPPAASRADVLTAAMYRFLRGRRIDVREIAAELGLGRTTIYRWFGSREGLIGEVLADAGEPLLNEARAEAEGQRWARAPRHVRPAQPEARRRSGAAPLRRAGARCRAPHPHDGRRPPAPHGRQHHTPDRDRGATGEPTSRRSSRRHSPTRSSSSRRRSSSTTPPPGCAATSTGCGGSCALGGFHQLRC